MAYDSFAARATTGMAMSGSPAYLPAGVTDDYAALRMLASDPRIDVNRIAIVGFSFGGEVAHLAAFEFLRSALNPGQAQFAAHVGFYPAGNFGAINTGPIPGPRCSCCPVKKMTICLWQRSRAILPTLVLRAIPHR